MATEAKEITVKLNPIISEKLDKMSKLLGMPRAQCINMMVTEWLKSGVGASK
jgi:hypothetical protein